MLVMRPRCENTKPSDRQLQYLIYHLERASAIADESGAAACFHACMLGIP